MSEKVAIVTGANRGIGFAITKNLCQLFNGVVYLTARDSKRGKDAIEELKKCGLNPEFHQLDISNQDSIIKLANYIKKRHGGIDILVNNVGIAYWHEDALVPFGEQTENTIAVNYFAVRNTCHVLFPLLRPHARVVNVSSALGHLPRIPGLELRLKLSSNDLTEEQLDEIMMDFITSVKKGTYRDKGWPYSAYVVSKVGLSALSRVHQRKFLKDPREDIIVNYVHPGLVATRMTKFRGPTSVEEGADAPTYLALLPENTKSPKGDFVWFNRQIVDWIGGPTPPIF